MKDKKIVLQYFPEIPSRNQWKYIEPKNNSADIAPRGLLLPTLASCNLKSGPALVSENLSSVYLAISLEILHSVDYLRPVLHSINFRV